MTGEEGKYESASVCPSSVQLSIYLSISLSNRCASPSPPAPSLVAKMMPSTHAPLGGGLAHTLLYLRSR